MAASPPNPGASSQSTVAKVTAGSASILISRCLEPEHYRQILRGRRVALTIQVPGARALSPNSPRAPRRSRIQVPRARALSPNPPQNLHDLLFTSVIGNASVHRGPTAPPTRVRLRWQNEAEPMEYRTGGVADNDERALAGLLFAPFFRARRAKCLGHHLRASTLDAVSLRKLVREA